MGTRVVWHRGLQLQRLTNATQTDVSSDDIAAGVAEESQDSPSGVSPVISPDLLEDDILDSSPLAPPQLTRSPTHRSRPDPVRSALLSAFPPPGERLLSYASPSRDGDHREVFRYPDGRAHSPEGVGRLEPERSEGHLAADGSDRRGFGPVIAQQGGEGAHCVADARVGDAPADRTLDA